MILPSFQSAIERRGLLGAVLKYSSHGTVRRSSLPRRNSVRLTPDPEVGGSPRLRIYQCRHPGKRRPAPVTGREIGRHPALWAVPRAV
jgi:hypothetical protein